MVSTSTELGIGKLMVNWGWREKKEEEGQGFCLHAVPGSKVFVYHLPSRQVAHSAGNLDSHVNQVLLGDGLEGSRTDRQARQSGIVTEGRKEIQKWLLQLAGRVFECGEDQNMHGYECVIIVRLLYCPSCNFVEKFFVQIHSNVKNLSNIILFSWNLNCRGFD